MGRGEKIWEALESQMRRGELDLQRTSASILDECLVLADGRMSVKDSGTSGRHLGVVFDMLLAMSSEDGDDGSKVLSDLVFSLCENLCEVVLEPLLDGMDKRSHVKA